MFADVRARGIDQVLRDLQLESLVGQSSKAIFAAITDAVCPSVETIDDALAREALLDTVLDMNEMGIADIATLDVEQMQVFFQNFIINAVLRRFLLDVSERGNNQSPTDFSYQHLDSDIRDFISGAVETRLAHEREAGGLLSLQFTAETIDRVFEAVWNVFEAMRP